MSIYTHVHLEYRPQIGERVYFWTGRGSRGYATVRQVRWHVALACELFLVEPDSSATKGADYWPRKWGSYWGPRDFGVRIEQLEHQPWIWFRNF